MLESVTTYSKEFLTRLGIITNRVIIATKAFKAFMVFLNLKTNQFPFSENAVVTENRFKCNNKRLVSQFGGSKGQGQEIKLG